MNTLRPPFFAAILGLSALLAGQTSAAEPATRDLEGQKEILRSAFERMPKARQRLLSGGALNAAQWARDAVERDRPGGQDRAARGVSGPSPLHPTESGRPGLIRVNDPRTDFTRSIVGGMTQSETSTGWCGQNVVVGFNDSGSIHETLGTTGGLSSAGFARSQNGGRSFTDRGALNPGPDPGGFLLGDPVIGCSSATRFHYASLFLLFEPTTALTAVSVSTSTDGGRTFGAPVVAVAKDISEHFLDKEWMAVDPANPRNLYVTYTDFGSFNTQPGCVDDFPTTIELVRSTDGGLTWSSPLVLDEACGVSFAQGSQVVVGPTGDVNVAWEQLPTFETRALAFRRSTNGGLTFGPTVKVADVTPAGAGYAYQGGFRSAEEFPSLSVDRSNGPDRGSLYIAWNDGRNRQIADDDSAGGQYGYADILVTRSMDNGGTWSSPVTANPDREDRTTDQYQPGIAVDRRGRVAACYYDRSLDPDNFKITRTCSLSRDGGQHWTFRRITDAGDSFIPFHGTDVDIVATYMGDYDALATDTLLESPGFVGGFLIEGFQGNQDVVANTLD